MRGPPSRQRARARTTTLNTHACFLSAGCGKHGEGNSPSAVETWPPITLPCGGIMWRRCGQEAAESLCPERAAGQSQRKRATRPHVPLPPRYEGRKMDSAQRRGFRQAAERKKQNSAHASISGYGGSAHERNIKVWFSETKDLAAIKTGLEGRGLPLAQPCREILTKILPRAKINSNHPSLVSPNTCSTKTFRQSI